MNVIGEHREAEKTTKNRTNTLLSTVVITVFSVYASRLFRTV